jgi:dienelactone hydrolase
LREQGLPLTPQWERPTGAVLDAFLGAHTQPAHIMLFGMSLGGYLAPRAAAFDARIDGVVAFDVLFDAATAAGGSSPIIGIVSGLTRHGYGRIADLLIRFAMWRSPGIKWGVNNSLWVMGLGAPHGLARALEFYTLKDVAQKIHGDVLILAGVDDQFVPLDQVKQFQAALTHARSVTTAVYDSDSGGEEHCQDGAITLWLATFFDWLLARYPAADRG